MAAYVRYYKRFSKTYHVQLQLESIVLKRKSLPSVSPLVDANFTAEVETLVLTAGHDAQKLERRVDRRVAGRRSDDPDARLPHRAAAGRHGHARRERRVLLQHLRTGQPLADLTADHARPLRRLCTGGCWGGCGRGSATGDRGQRSALLGRGRRRAAPGALGLRPSPTPRCLPATRARAPERRAGRA